MFNKKFIFIFVLNLLIVATINIIAYFYSYQVNLEYFLYILAFLVIIGFFLIIFELFFYMFLEINKKNYFFIGFLGLIISFFILKFNFYGDYFYFRYENYLHFKDYFLIDFKSSLYSVLNDFRNFNGIILINLFNEILPKEGITQYYIYSFFQFIGGIFLYRIFSLFSKDKILPILLTFLYFGIEMFFIISQTITYVNIILSAFIIFLFYLFNLEKNKNFNSYLLYFSSYLFLITSRPDFFFLALIIEFLNAYFKYKNIISLKQNIFFYVFLIPYYFIINHYLLTHISGDEGLLGKTYETDNFWYIIFDKIFGEDMQTKLINNLQIIANDYLFVFYFIISLFGLFYIFYTKINKLKFSYLFLFAYSVFFFFIVIFIHKEGFISSFFKYFSMIYLIVFILFGFFLIQFLRKIKNYNYKILGYIILFMFIIFNYNISLSNYTKLFNYSYSGKNSGELFKSYDINGDTVINIYDRIYDILFWENVLYKNNFLEKEIRNGCLNTLVGKFEHDYTQLFSEFDLKAYPYNYFYLKEKCINLIKVSEGNYINFNNNDSDFIIKLNNNFIIVKTYDKFIGDNKWLNLYVLKNKNAK